MGYEPGDRVGLNAEGLAQDLGRAGRLGTVAGRQEPAIVRLIWDDLRTPEEFHPSLLFLAPPSATVRTAGPKPGKPKRPARKTG
jgi:hypothetical protein